MMIGKKHLKFKRMLAGLLSVLMLLGHMPTSVFAVDASATETVTSADSLELGSSVTVESETQFAFTPTTSGVYCFYSTSEESVDPTIQLLDSNKQPIAYDDDGGEGYNFELHYEMTAGTTYYVQAGAYSDKFSYTLTVEESDLLSIEIVSVPVLEVEEYDMSNGGWRSVYRNEVVDRYFEYSAHEALRQAVIKVNYKDGTSEELAFFDENEDWTGISMEWDFYLNPWKVGSDNHYYITYKGMKALANATVVESSVTSIELVSISGTEFVEMDETQGYWTRYYQDLELDEKYFCYEIESVAGSIELLVTYADGSTEQVSYLDDDENYTGIYIYCDQYQLPWTLGENEFEIWYKSACITATATVVESPVQSLRVIEGGSFEYSEFDESNGYWMGDTEFYYYPYRFMQDVVLEVTYKDGSTAEIVAAEDNAVRYRETQHDTPWTVDGDNELLISYKGATTTAQVTIKPSIVESISVEDVVIAEGTHCYFNEQDTPDGTDIWCHYNVFADDITVNLTDGTTLRGDQEYISQELGTSINFTPEKYQYYEERWGVGEYTVTASVFGKKADFLFVIEESDIESISVEDIELEQNKCGYWDTDGYWNDNGDWVEGEEWFCYHPGEQAQMTVTFKDGTSFTGTMDQFCNEYSMPSRTITNQTYQNQWQVGGTYTAKVYLGSKYTEFSVTIVENDITGIEVIDTQDFVYYENDIGQGEWRDDFFYYSAWDLVSRMTIRVNYKDGTTMDVSYYDENDNPSGIDYSTDQYETPWTIGGENLITITYEGAKTTVSAIVEPSPVASIEVEKVTHIEGTGGYWNSDSYWDDEGNRVEVRYYYYDCEPQNITVTFTDGTSVSGNIYEIYAQTGVYPARFYEQSYQNQWGIGEHTATISFMGKTAEYNVSIVESNVASITVEPVTYIEHTNGDWSYYWDDDKGEEQQYYHYYLNPNQVTIVYTDGTSISGTPYDIEEWTGYSVCTYSDQSYYNHWGVGTHTATVAFMGKTAEYTISIVESDIASVEVEDITYIEGTGGHWSSYGYWDDEGNWVEEKYYYYDCYPQNITITYKDGTSISGTSEEIHEQTGGYFDCFSEQGYENQWGIGEHTATISFMGKTAEYTVSIVESDVASITVEPVTYIEHTNGDWYSYWDDKDEEQQYYYYYLNPNQVTVVYTDGTSISGTPYEIEEQTGYRVYTYSDQSYYNHWGVGTHTATAAFLGKTVDFSVEITASPVESITVETVYIEEGTNGYWQYSNPGGYYFGYYPRPQSMTIHYTDGTELTGSYDELSAQLDGQLSYGTMEETIMWGVGTHTATVSYMGITVEYDVVITPTQIESITVMPIIAVAGKDGWTNSEYFDKTESTWYSGQWYEYNTNPEMMIVTFKDGTIFTGHYEDFDYLGYASRLEHDQGYHNEWGSGVHTVTLVGVGFETSYEVEIVDEVEGEEFSYGVLSDGTAVIVDYHGSATDVVIPDTIDGYTVSTIASYSLSHSDIQSLTVPETVKYIQRYAFYLNQSLQTVRLYAGVEVIGTSAFEDCYSLSNVVFYGSSQQAEDVFVFEGNEYLKNAQWQYTAECTEHQYDSDCDAECNVCYVVREPKHAFEWVIDNAGNCVENGWKHESCTLCGATRNLYTEITAKGEHTNTELQGEEPATCSEWGYTGDVYCHDCNTYIAVGEPIEPTGQHQNTDIINELNATCSREGYTGDLYCNDCDSIVAPGETIPVKEHENTDIINELEATCGQTGYTGDLYCYDCNSIIECGEEIAATEDHQNTQLQNKSDATCGHEGYTGDLLCLDCKTVVEYGEVIPATGNHGTLTIVDATSATCDEVGYTGDVLCKECSTIVQYGQEIPATNKHEYDNGYDADCNQCGAIREVTLKPATLSLNGGTTYQGDTIRVEVCIDGNTGFAGLQLGVLYDSTYLTLKDVETEMENFFVTVGNSVVFDAAKNHTADGVIATLVFEVAKDAPIGEYDVQLRFMSGSTEDFEAVIMTDCATTIKVESAVEGDANGDGKVDTIDLVMLRRYLASMDPVTMTSDVALKKGADANGDGVVDAIDLAFVRQYLASMSAV